MIEAWDLEQILSSMVILVDTREQDSERAEKRYKSFSVPYIKKKLDYGDYSAEYRDLFGDTHRINTVIERKMNLEELSSCFTSQRKRFEKEFERAKKDKANVYLLVENATWENLINGKYKTRFNAKSFLASITAWMARYDIKIIFCKKETSGKMIQEILYRELKEEVSNG